MFSSKLLLPGAFLLSSVVAYVVNYSSFQYYFFQDDWFVLNNVKHLSLAGLVNVFIPRTDIIYYRPVGMQSFFYAAFTLFGLNSFLFHLAAFAWHIVNLFLVYKVANVFLKDFKSSLCVMFLYAGASFHFMTLSWLVLTWNTIANSFILLAILFYTKTKLKPLAFFAFMVAIFSSEFALILPGLFLVWELYRAKRPFLRNLVRATLRLSYFLLVPPAYLFFRIFVFPIPAQGTYSPQIQTGILKDLIWYLLWFMNVPEQLKFHINFTNFHLTADILNAAGPLLPFVGILFISLISILFFIFCKVLRGRQAIWGVVCLFLFFICLAPVITLPNHSYPYYLTFPALFLFLFFGLLIREALKKDAFSKILVIFFLLNWILLSAVSNSVNRKTHWLVGEQSISRKATVAALAQSPKFDGKPFVIYPGSKEVAQALMNQEALRVVYGAKNVETIFQNSKEDVFANSNLIIWNNQR